MDYRVMTQEKSPPETFIEDENELGKLLGTLIDGRRIIFAITALFALFGLLYALFATPIYRADALLQVEEKSSGMASITDMGEFFAADSSAVTEIEVLKSRMVLGEVVDELRLDVVTTPRYFPIFGKGLARMSGNSGPGILPFLFSGYAWDEELIRVTQFDVPDAYKGKELTLVAGEEGGYSLYFADNVILTGKVGEIASAQGFRIMVTDLISRPGVEFRIQKQSRTAAVRRLQEKLAVAERGNRTGILALSFDGEEPGRIRQTLDSISKHYLLQNIQRMSAEAEKSLAFLDEQLPGIKARLDDAENALNRYRLQHESVDLSLETKSILEQVVNLEAQLNELTFKESELSRRFKTTHPNYIALLQKRETLLKQKEDLSKQVHNLPETQQEILRLTRDVETSQEIYLQLLNKNQELKIVKASTVGNVRILDRAELMEHSVKPKKTRLVIIWTLLGFMLGWGVVWLRNALNRGIQNPAEIERIGLHVYATIPLSNVQRDLERKAKQRSKPQAVGPGLLAQKATYDSAVEALRSLRTSMHFAMLEADNNILMISGPAPDLGKSFISANLAAIYAQGHNKVLLIDGDMRKGHIHRQLGMPRDKGLSELISGQVTRDEAIRKTTQANLEFISTGRIPPNPAELLMHPNFSQFLEWASSTYDMVFIDSSPILAVADASVIGRIAGMTMLVARFDKTTAREIELANKRCDQSGVHVNGCIINGVVKKASNYYGYGSYGDYQYDTRKQDTD